METPTPSFYGPGSTSDKARMNVERLKDPNFISVADEERKKKKRLWELSKRKGAGKDQKPPEGVATETLTFYDRKRQEALLRNE